MPKIALSYSRLSTYETCPRQFQAKFLTKTYPEDPDNPYFKRGTEIHRQLEEFVNALLNGKEPAKLMDDIQRAGKIAKAVVDNYDVVYTEQQIAINSNLEVVSWFDKSAYYRVIFDLVGLSGDKGLIIDWKSGKVRDYDDKSTGQLHLAAAILMLIKPQINEVKTAYAFVEHQQTISRTFTRDELDKLIAPFVEAHKVVNADKEFTPKKNRYCYFCEISPSECELKK